MKKVLVLLLLGLLGNTVNGKKVDSPMTGDQIKKAHKKAEYNLSYATAELKTLNQISKTIEKKEKSLIERKIKSVEAKKKKAQKEVTKTHNQNSLLNNYVSTLHEMKAKLQKANVKIPG